MNLDPSPAPVAVITGGSAGLGKSIAAALLEHRYRVVIMARNVERLAGACRELEQALPGAEVCGISASLEHAPDVNHAFDQVHARFGRLDVLVNNVGMSDRGTVANLSAERMLEVVSANLLPTLLCSQAAFSMLAENGGVVVNVGSLASKVGARFLGGYPAAKHAVAGLTQQMRLEWREHGVHVALISPGPIRRDDAGSRYASAVAGDRDLPEQASKPGGGTRVRGLDSERVAARVVAIIGRRQADVMVPTYLRPLVAVGHLWPRLGDWLLMRFTNSRKCHKD